jgi:hypothetical protein
VNIVPCRSCTWEEALRQLEQARTEEAASNSYSMQPTDAARSFRRNASMSGFYMTRNAFQGKHFVALILEKSAVASRGTTVIIVRPTTGRNETQKQDVRDKFKLIPKPEDARKMWEALYEESCQPDASGAQRRYFYHNLLAGSVLDVWSRIESYYTVLNGRAPQTSEGNTTVKRYTMRIARVTVGGAVTAEDVKTEEAKGADVESVVVSPSKRRGRTVAGSLVASPVPALKAVQQESEHSASGGDALNLVGIWIPQPRIKEVLALLRIQRAEMEKGNGTA